MDPKLIDRFFQTLSEEFDQPATVILTGAAAGSLLGHIRASRDIDFAVQPARRDARTWERLAAAIDRTMRQVGVEVNYAEDIDRWSSIAFLDYRRHTTAYRRFGTLRVRVLDPVYWAIGKLGRYLEIDVNDLIAVLTRHRVPVSRALAVWGAALRASPRSAALFQFRRQVEHFLRTYGRTIWGRGFTPELAVRRFLREAGLVDVKPHK
jgi:hypothetical protein